MSVEFKRAKRRFAKRSDEANERRLVEVLREFKEEEVRARNQYLEEMVKLMDPRKPEQFWKIVNKERKSTSKSVKPYKARFIANSSSCTTTELSKLLTSRLTAIKKHVIKYCEKVYERSGKNLFWSIKNSGEILDKLKARDFNATCLSTYDFSTLYTTLPHNLIKDKLIDLIERTFQGEGSPYLACSDRNAFFISEKPKKYHAWSCQNVCDALTFLLDNIFI